MTQGSIQCSISGVTIPSSVTCDISNRVLTVSNCFPSSDSRITFDVYSITNPNFATTSESFQILTYSSTSAEIDKAISGLSIVFDSVPLISAQILTGSQISGEKSD